MNKFGCSQSDRFDFCEPLPDTSSRPCAEAYKSILDFQSLVADMSFGVEDMWIIPIERIESACRRIEHDVRTLLDEMLMSRHVSRCIPCRIREKCIFDGNLGYEHYEVSESEGLVERGEGERKVGQVSIG